VIQISILLVVEMNLFLKEYGGMENGFGSIVPAFVLLEQFSFYEFSFF